MNNKKIIFSGIKPSGDLHLGNYLGAISQWVGLQDNYECLFCVVNYHAITVYQDPETLKKRTKEIVKVYLASGIDPQRSNIFLQSDVSEHTELAWILNCTSTRMSDLNNMTQFKDKAKNKGENVSAGLFNYPVLMAADILLYNTDVVPVGDDQVQHVELCRDLAKRFNHDYAPTFKLPEAMIRKQGARIMSLTNPDNKMSKSADSDAGCIFLNDDPEIARKKVMRAVTDSGSEIKYDLNEKPAVSNLMTIYSLLTGESYKDLKKMYSGKGYGDFKKGLAEVVVKFLTDFQAKYNSISDKEVQKALEDGATCAKVLAQETIKKVKENVGII
ncbi:MAG: tryptophan--tRNA ligase [Patescibacteria group bacterium]